MNLKQSRHQLNIIDNQLIKLVAQRQKIVKKIALFKKKHNINIFQPQREKQILIRQTKIGSKLNLNNKFIVAFFKLLMNESKRIQRKNINNKT